MKNFGKKALKLALAVDKESTIEHLVHFHKMERKHAERLTRPIYSNASPLLLHETPYMIAYQLIHGYASPSLQTFKADQRMSHAIYEKALRNVSRDIVNAPRKKKTK